MSSEHADEDGPRVDGDGSAGVRPGPAGSTAVPEPSDTGDGNGSDGPGAAATPGVGPVDDAPRGVRDADAGSELGRRGWVLVGVVVLCFLVIPGLIYLRPAAPGGLGLPFLVATLVLPLVPAALLGATAVWSAVANREGRERE